MDKKRLLIGIFVIYLFLHVIDFLFTYIGISNGYSEGNILVNWLFGILGLFNGMAVVTLTIFGILWITNKLFHTLEENSKNKILMVWAGVIAFKLFAVWTWVRVL